MPTRKLLLLLIIATLLILSFSSVTGQETASEWVVIGTNDGLLAIPDINFGQPLGLSFCGRLEENEGIVSPLALSPDGDHLAYSISSSGAEGTSRYSLRHCDGIVLSEVRINESLNTLQGLTAASAPIWSPDSIQLASIVQGQDGRRGLLIFNRNSQAATFTPLDDLGTADLVQIRLSWNRTGIYFISQGTDSSLTLERFNATTNSFERFDNPLAITSPAVQTLDVQNGNQVEVAMILADGTIHLFNTDTREWRVLDGSLRLSSTQSEGGISLLYNPSNSDSPWQVEETNGNRSPLPYNAPWHEQSISIAPNGQSLVFISDALYQWQGARLRTLSSDIDQNSSLVWATLAWEVVGN